MSEQEEVDLDNLRASMAESRVREIGEVGGYLKRYLAEIRGAASEARAEIAKIERSIIRLQNMAAKLSTYAKQ